MLWMSAFEGRPVLSLLEGGNLLSYCWKVLLVVTLNLNAEEEKRCHGNAIILMSQKAHAMTLSSSYNVTSSFIL